MECDWISPGLRDNFRTPSPQHYVDTIALTGCNTVQYSTKLLPAAGQKRAFVVALDSENISQSGRHFL